MRIDLSEVDLQAIRNAVGIHAAVLRAEIAQSSDRDTRASLRAEPVDGGLHQRVARPEAPDHRAYVDARARRDVVQGDLVDPALAPPRAYVHSASSRSTTPGALCCA